MKIKLTIRVPQNLIKNAKRYANAHHTTLTELISAYLQRIPVEDEALEKAPMVRQLTGILSIKVSVADYKKHFEEKYGGQ